MAKQTVLVMTLLVSFLAIGVWPAHAGHRDRYRSESRIDHRRLESLSHQLERKVRHVRREAERRFDDRKSRRRGTLVALHRLERRAGRFHAQVERRPRAVRHLTADFHKLDRSFRVATDRMGRVRSRQLRRDLRKVRAVMGELERELHRSARIARRDRPRQRRDHARDWRRGFLVWNW